MNRRTYLASFGVGAAALSGGIVLGTSENNKESPTDGPVGYEHEDVRLQTLQDSVRLGETIQFKVTNTSDSTVVLGCENSWIMQTYSDGKWQDVTEAPASRYQMCASELPAGESRVENATMSKDKLETQTGDLLKPLQPGKYRFVLLWSEPRLAVDFQITPSE